jgi:hypothetical protein
VPESIQAEPREVRENAKGLADWPPPCVLRLFGAQPGAVRRAVAALPDECRVRARALTRGGETLLVLEADSDERLRLAAQQLQAALAEAAYGQGEQTLPAAAVAALVQRELLLVCADAATGALLEPRLEALDGAERVFDFGAQSYLHPKHAARIAAAGRKWAERARPEYQPEYTDEPEHKNEAAARQAIGRLQMARRLTEADLAAAAVPLRQGTLLLLGRQKGLWLRVVPPDEAQNPALWLLDMIRRAAAGLEQAAGSRWARYGEPLGLQEAIACLPAQVGREEAGQVPADARSETGTPWAVEPGEQVQEPLAEPQTERTVASTKPGHKGRRRLLRLVLLVLLLVAAVGVVWQYTGGSWETLRKSLGLSEFSLSGASLL